MLVGKLRPIAFQNRAEFSRVYGPRRPYLQSPSSRSLAVSRRIVARAQDASASDPQLIRSEGLSDGSTLFVFGDESDAEESGGKLEVSTPAAASAAAEAESSPGAEQAPAEGGSPDQAPLGELSASSTPADELPDVDASTVAAESVEGAAAASAPSSGAPTEPNSAGDAATVVSPTVAVEPSTAAVEVGVQMPPQEVSLAERKVLPPEDEDASSAPTVEEALAAAMAALADAEEKLANVELLPSAAIPWEMPAPLAALLRVAGLAAVAAIFWWSQLGGSAARVAGSLAAGAAIGWLGWCRGSLSVSGALAAAAVGGGTLAASFRCGATLLAFYFSSSKLTALAEDRKETDDAFKAGGQRDWKQVCSNALIPLLAALALVPITGGADVLLSSAASRDAVRYLGAFFGYYACCCGDTWASELGQLSSIEPRLITTMRPVRRGTNGGVTPLGFAASAAGGLFVGLAFWAAALISPTLAGSAAFYQPGLQQWRLVPLGGCIGLIGSILDSVLGATLQFSGFNRQTGRVTSQYSSDMVQISGIPLLSNNAVNVVSASCSAAICSVLCLRLF